MNTINVNNHILLLSTIKGLEVIDCDTIIRIEAVSNYSKLFFSNGKILVVAKVLGWFESQLLNHHFIRIHRTHLFNINCINRFSNNKVRLINEEYISVSKRKKKIFLEQLYLKVA